MTSLYDIPTPSVVIDGGRLAANVARMQATASAAGLRLRPHAKTHKLPRVAHQQVAAGAVGICCAKLGEAEVFAAAGIDDIRVPYPLHPVNAERVVTLLERVRLSTIVDHPRIAREWSAAMVGRGQRLPVLVKVDVGFHRCGVDPHTPAALELVQLAHELPGLELLGLLSHAGHAYAAPSADALAAVAREEAETLGALAEAARRAGVPIAEVSVGSTPQAQASAGLPGLTEIRPGNYVYYDRTQVALDVARLQDCALTVIATVVSKPADDRIVLDCGSKTLSSDLARGFVAVPGHGAVFPSLDAAQPDAALLIERLSEEHATVRVTDGATTLEPGDRVRVLPNHSCVVSNLVDWVVFAEGPAVLDRVPVAARGRIQ
jgi:D-serine deaminase-like pyridoxal phosphate-dependent protein